MILTLVILAALIIGGLCGYLIFRYVIKFKYNEMLANAEKASEVIKEKKLLEVKEKFINKKAELEQEISELEDDEKAMFLEEMGIEESGLDKLIKASYRLLDLISFLTTGEDETRAWTIKVGTKAPQAAGKIHTDFEKGFIRAETINYDVLMAECDGSMVKAKEKGLLRSEGKEYVVKDGDIITFLFNV